MSATKRQQTKKREKSAPDPPVRRIRRRPTIRQLARNKKGELYFLEYVGGTMTYHIYPSGRKILARNQITVGKIIPFPLFTMLKEGNHIYTGKGGIEMDDVALEQRNQSTSQEPTTRAAKARKPTPDGTKPSYADSDAARLLEGVSRSLRGEVDKPPVTNASSITRSRQSRKTAASEPVASSVSRTTAQRAHSGSSKPGWTSSRSKTRKPNRYDKEKTSSGHEGMPAAQRTRRGGIAHVDNWRIAKGETMPGQPNTGVDPGVAVAAGFSHMLDDTEASGLQNKHWLSDDEHQRDRTVMPLAQSVSAYVGSASIHPIESQPSGPKTQTPSSSTGIASNKLESGGLVSFHSRSELLTCLPINVTIWQLVVCLLLLLTVILLAILVLFVA